MNKFFLAIFKIINFITIKKNNINIQKSYTINGLIKIRNKGLIKIGDSFKSNSGGYYNPLYGYEKTILIIEKNAQLTIKNNVGISNSIIFSSNKISIGNNVLIGGGCKIIDSDFHSLDPYIRIKRNDNAIVSSPITIEDNVFIGAGTFILKGVTIGINSVIGAGSVVSKNIPKNEIWAGNPTRFIKKVEVSNDL